MELETTRETTATARSTATEELCKWMTTAGEAALEGVTTLTTHRVVRVIAVVEALPEFWIRKDLIRLVHRSHLRLGATFIGMCFHRRFPAGDTVSIQKHSEVRNTYNAFLMVLVSASRGTSRTL